MDFTFSLPADMLMFLVGFLFMFAVVYGLLAIAKIFGDRINAVIAIVFGLFAAFYGPFALFLWIFMPIASIILLVVFFIVFLKKVFSSDEEKKTIDLVPLMVIMGIFLLIIGIFWQQLPLGLTQLASSNLLWLVGLIIIVILFWAAYKTDNKTTTT